MNRLLIVCGPTATGKTELALQLSDQFNGELVSADSRQVYRGLDIGTGKDLPVNFEFRISNFEFNTRKVLYYSDGKTRIWGLDIVNPDEEFSVAHYRKFVQIVLSDIYKRNKLPIIVGGTGLYIKSLLEPLSAIAIPRNETLRKTYENASLETLQNALNQINPHRFTRMNHSDRNNLRRLIRALEVSLYDKTHTTYRSHKAHIENYNPLIIGLTASDEILRKRIKKRVEKRREQGIDLELKKLLEKGYSLDLPALSATGYKTISNSQFLISHEKRKAVLDKWVQEEFKYAKRQMTWFKKQKNVHWFDVETTDYKKHVVEMVEEWYTEKYATEN